MPSSKKLTCKGTLRQLFICLRPGTPYPTPPYTLYCIRVYSILFHTVKGGGVEPERRGDEQHLSKLVRKYQHD
jgi:hypothetical protein